MMTLEGVETRSGSLWNHGYSEGNFWGVVLCVFKQIGFYSREVYTFRWRCFYNLIKFPSLAMSPKFVYYYFFILQETFGY